MKQGAHIRKCPLQKGIIILVSVITLLSVCGKIFGQEENLKHSEESIIDLIGCDSVIYDNNNGFREIFFEDFNIMETLPSASCPTCDSTIIVRIKINRSKTDTVLLTGNDSIVWSGNIYFSDTSITEKKRTSTGCDSITTFNIIIIQNIKYDTVETNDTLSPPLLTHIFDTTIMAPYGSCQIPRHNLPDPIPKISYGWLKHLDTCINDASELLRIDSTYTINWKILLSNGRQDSITQTVTIIKPPCGEGFHAIDADGKHYKTVRLGCDCWMAENLASRHYGAAVPAIGGEAIPTALAYHVDMFPDTAANVSEYGRLYDWYSAVGLIGKLKDSMLRKNATGHIQGVCPDGWYLPCDTNLQVLLNYNLKGLKSISGWLTGNGCNEYGFNVKPAGYYDSAEKEYYNILGNAYFWSWSEISMSEAVNCAFKYNCDTSQINITEKANGYSIRCLKE